MNEYTDAIYNYILETCNQVLTTTEYRIAEQDCNREEKALLDMLTPEQQEQFYRCKERESVLESVNLRFMFQQTLHFLCGIFCS